MTPDRWRQVNDLFHAALQVDAAARDAFLGERTSADPELEAEVRSLLNSHERSATYLDQPVWTVAADLLADDEPSLIGQTIGKYRVLKELARGGMGVVYIARDEVLDRTVAVKALPPEYATDSARRERLMREARTAARLAHRAIATVYELQEHNGQIYIVSEYIPGATLRRELDDGPLPPAHLVGTLIEIASALAAAHSRNIVHRDLKPENIIRREDGQIKVLDFGLARTIHAGDLATVTRQTEPGIVPGTPGYMAPELFAGQEADARSDVFVFGVLAWELATGAHPFGTSNRSRLARLLDLAEGRDVPLVGPVSPPGLEAIARRCLSPVPQDRYPSAEAILDDLRKLQTSDAPMPAAPLPQRLWWWQFHQATMAVLNAATPVAAWLVRVELRRGWASWVFFLVLALAIGAVTMRLNLLFTSRVHTDLLVAHRTRIFPWIIVTECTIAAILLASAVAIGPTDEVITAVLIGLAIVILALLAIIEPATTRGAGMTGGRR